MRKQNSKRWLISFGSGTVAFLTALAIIAYIIDPFFQFRIKDNSYMLSGQFVSSGLIKNYDYDTLIIGSSMTQNFNMDVFREELGCKPLHIGLGGITATEELELLELAYAAEKAEKYYICADMYMFTDETEKSSNPQYLLKEDFLSRCRYLLSYEVWFRYIPVNLAFMTLDYLEIDQPLKFEYSKSIDRLEDWSLDVTFGEEVVLSNYESGAFSVSKVDAENLYNRMTVQIDKYFSEIEFEKGEYVFFFAPYSMLYWCDTQVNGTFDAYMQAKQYFIEKASEHGAIVYDFQAAECTSDLNNYKDTTHYTPEINDWMIRCFANQEYTTTKETVEKNRMELTERANYFRQQYVELFNY